ncbi:MAG: raffinose/stachyose/melibiose transport system permease protein [Streptosporangiaceae bacterium]|jgi:ABC-type glycerol-3-phosphate transport system permease component|nr:raffinose/stachyose/melibiose transport system permease protein [Streptosporangiaceae bacterium]
MAAADSLPAPAAPAGPASGPPPAKRALRARRRSRVGMIFLIMTGIAVVMLYPFWYLLNNAFRTQSQFEQQHGHSAVSWSQLFSELPVGRELLNSTLICLASILLILAVSTTAGFAFAKLRYRGSGTLFLAVVAALMVPLQSIIIPEYVNLGKLGLINTYLGAILVYVALGTPFATFLMATYYRGISDDLIEAAVMDGLGYERTFLRIALPLSWPAIATVTVLQFIQIWDDLLVGLLFLQNPQQRTITVGLAALSAGRTSSIPVLMAGSFISAVPAIVVYLIFQRYLVRGLTLGMGK